MSLIQELKNFDATPDYAETLKPFPRAAIARRLGIGASYVSNILSGSKTPSKKIHKMLTELAGQIQAEGGHS